MTSPGWSGRLPGRQRAAKPGNKSDRPTLGKQRGGQRLAAQVSSILNFTGVLIMKMTKTLVLVAVLAASASFAAARAASASMVTNGCSIGWRRSARRSTSSSTSTGESARVRMASTRSIAEA